MKKKYIYIYIFHRKSGIFFLRMLLSILIVTMLAKYRIIRFYGKMSNIKYNNGDHKNEILQSDYNQITTFRDSTVINKYFS